MKTTRIGIAALAILALPHVAAAHHPWFKQFDPCAPTVITGKVAAVEWINPHAVIHVTTNGPRGVARTYAVMAGTPNSIARRGLAKDMLAIGSEVVVRGYLEREPRCWESLANHIETCNAGGRTLTIAGRTFAIGAGAPSPPAPSGWPEAERDAGGFRTPEDVASFPACPAR